MKTLLIYLALLAGQMNTLQEKQIVHLAPNHENIDATFGGELLELINAPAVIQLPTKPPKTDSTGNPWIVDVKNLGPGVVTVQGKGQFSVKINIGQTVHIFSNGAAYSLKR
jgi:hypothetical protein